MTHADFQLPANEVSLYQILVFGLIWMQIACNFLKWIANMVLTM